MFEEDPYAEVARDNAIAVERANEREDDEDHDDRKKIKACTYHPDGQHRFLPCDEWSRTCWCGKTEK